MNIDANRDDEYVTSASDVQFSIVEFFHLIDRYVVQWSWVLPCFYIMENEAGEPSLESF